MAIWNGSLTTDSVISATHDPSITAIEMALDAVNSNEATTFEADTQLLGNFVKTIEGTAGTYEVFKDFSGLFQDDADFLDPEEFKEEYAKWSFERKGYAIKNGSFDKKTLKDAEERGYDLNKVVVDRTMEILSLYNRQYKSNIIYETLLTVPTVGGGFYEKFGAVRNTTVKPRKLVNYNPDAVAGDIESNVRNNFRAIKDASGLGLSDLYFVQDYMGNVEGVDEQNLIVVGQQSAISQIAPLFDNIGVTGTKEEILLNGIPTGVQAFTINGMTLVGSKKMPKDLLMFVNPDAPYLISKLISKVPKYQGVAIETIDANDKIITDAKSLLGSKIVIQEEGYHMSGRLDVLFLDIDKTRNDANRLMTAGGITVIENARQRAREKWYKSVNA
jgi:hypothetical protein